MKQAGGCLCLISSKVIGFRRAYAYHTRSTRSCGVTAKAKASPYYLTLTLTLRYP